MCKRMCIHIIMCSKNMCSMCVIVYNFPVLLCAKCANFAVFAWWWCGLCKIWVIHCNFQEFTGFSQVHWPWVLIAWISCSSQELWVKCTKSGRFAGNSESSLLMVSNLKALMYSGSINGANFASFAVFWGELHEICMNRWKFVNFKIDFANFACNFKDGNQSMYG